MGPPHYVELHHYVGPTLISQHTNKRMDQGCYPCLPRKQHVFTQNEFQTSLNSAWTGMPLVQFTSKRSSKEGHVSNYKNSLMKLAIRTHGIPLILNGYSELDYGQFCLPYCETFPLNFEQRLNLNVNSTSPVVSDSTSVTSEESGFSEYNSKNFHNSEKKASKKEKKTFNSSVSGALITLEPYTPLMYKFRNNWTKSDAKLSKSKRKCTCQFCFPKNKADENDSDFEFDRTFTDELGKSEENSRGMSTKNDGTYQPRRPWITLERVGDKRTKCVFTVMCYNVLCDRYATQQMFGYCPSWALNWEYRRKAIIDEIRHYSADVITLQEIETDQFYKFFLPELKQDGYDGIFAPKSRAKTMSEYKRKFVDGCAIFYRTTKFSLVSDFLIEFNQIAMANAQGSDDMLNRVMTKDDIALAAILQTKQINCETGEPQPILICTAHIHWDPENCDVKLIQTIMVMHELQKISEEMAKRFYSDLLPDCSRIPLLLCGDFNSFPDSGVIEFLTSGCVKADHSDFKKFAYQSCLSRLSSTVNKNAFTHSFKMARAYTDEIMPFTNYTCDFKGIIDYIFYTKTLMNPTGLLGAFDHKWFNEQKIIGCPHPQIPSDHLSLLVEFEMFLSSNTSEEVKRIEVQR